MENDKRSNTEACASCKYQRRKCRPDCLMAPYFPANPPGPGPDHFPNAHKLFGVRNIIKILKNVDPKYKSDTAVSIIYQSNARARDPVGGCRTIINHLQKEREKMEFELYRLRLEVQSCREIVAYRLTNDQDFRRFFQDWQNGQGNLDQGMGLFDFVGEDERIAQANFDQELGGFDFLGEYERTGQANFEHERGLFDFVGQNERIGIANFDQKLDLFDFIPENERIAQGNVDQRLGLFNFIDENQRNARVNFDQGLDLINLVQDQPEIPRILNREQIDFDAIVQPVEDQNLNCDDPFEIGKGDNELAGDWNWMK